MLIPNVTPSNVTPSNVTPSNVTPQNPVPPKKLLPYRSADFCKKFAQALSQSECAHEVAVDHKETVDYYLNHLCMLINIKMCPVGILFEDAQVKYELRRDDVNIYVTRINYVEDFFVSTLSSQKREEGREDLCTLPVKKIMDVRCSLFMGERIANADKAIALLLIKNNLVAGFRGLPCFNAENEKLVRNEPMYIWLQESAVIKNKDPMPQFDYTYDGDKILSEDLTNFFKDCTIPHSNSQKTLLLWECWQIMGWSDQLKKVRGPEYLQFILNHIQHLDFSLVKFQTDPDFLRERRSLFEFLERRFAGSGISFDNMTVNDDLVDLIKELYQGDRRFYAAMRGNPNLIRLDMTNCVLPRKSIIRLGNFIGENRCRLTELHLDGSILDANVDEILRPALMRNCSLKVLSMKNNAISVSVAKSLVTHPSIISLDFEGNTVPWSDVEKNELLYCLKNNTTLTSLKIDWGSEEKRRECEGYQNRNFLNQHGDSYINFYQFLNTDLLERTQGELPDGLPLDVKNIIFSMLYVLNHDEDMAG